MRVCVASMVFFCMAGCAALHRTQLADIEPAQRSHHISVKVSETTLDFREMADLAKLGGRLFKSTAARNVGRGFEAYTTLFQFGPRTGTPVYNEQYARFVPEMLREKCPRGRVGNIVSVRETRAYPVVKGEIVRVEADCFE